MSWGAVAVIGAAVIGGVASNSAAKKGAKASERGQDILAQSREQARGDVMTLFPQAQTAQTEGFEGFRQFITGQVLPKQIQGFQQGNIAAQQQISRGLPQIQSALLGLPTDLSGFQARQIGQPGQFNFALPPTAEEQRATAAAAQPQQPQFDIDAFRDAIKAGSLDAGFGGSGIGFGGSGIMTGF